MEARVKETQIHESDDTRRILAVLAHPDDETFGLGGSLAYYARKGVEITLICTTHGEAGDVEPQYLEGHESIAELRSAELHCAAQTLGLHAVIQFDHRDSGMQGSPTNDHPDALINAPLDEVAAEIAEIIRRVRPQVVVTHDPVGNYFHPDHIATHEATTMAFFMAGDETFKGQENLPAFEPDYLYFYTFPRKRMKWLLWVMPLLGMDPKRFGRNNDIDLARILTMQMPVHVEVNFRDAEDVREQASRCHASQGGGQRSMTLFGRVRRWLSATKDSYMQAYPEVSNGRVRGDLFG